MANSAVVGILKAILEADTATFTAKMNEASKDVQDLSEALAKDLEPRQRAVNAAVKDFLGGREIQKAEEYALAVEKIGGANNLTERDQLKVNRALNDALSHYRVLGVEAPAHLQKLEQETRKVSTSTGVLDNQWVKMAATFASTVLLDRLVSGLVNLGKALVEDAGQMVDLSQKTGLSIRALQVYGQVAKETGSTVENVADAVFKLGVNIENGGDKITKALSRLGLSYEHIRNLKPEQQFAEIAAKLQAVEMAQERNRLGVDLFGKSWATVAPAVVEGLDSIAEKTVIVGDAQVKAIDKAAEAWDRFVENSKKRAMSFLGGLILEKQLADQLRAEADQGSTFAQDAYARYLGLLVNNKNDEALKFIIAATDRHKDVLLETAQAATLSAGAEKELAKQRQAATVAAQKRAAAELEVLNRLQRAFDVTKVIGQRVTLGLSPTDIEYADQLIVNLQLYQALLDEDTQHRKDQAAALRALIVPAKELAGIFETLPGTRIELGPPPDPSKYKAAGDNLAIISGLLTTIGQNTTGTFSEIALASGHMSQLVVAHFQAIAAGANAASTAAALGWGVITLGFSVWAQEMTKNKASISEFKKRIQELQVEIAALGGVVPTMKEVADEFTRMTGRPQREFGYQDYIDELTRRLKGLQDEAERTTRALINVGQSGKTWQELEEIAKDLGIDITKLGKAFDALKLNDVGQKLADSWGLFKKAGTDNLVVLEGMQDEVNAWLKSVQNAGLKIPEYMRPILAAMANAGYLTDAAGNKLEDLSTLEFAPDLEQGLEDVAEGLQGVEGAIRDLIEVLTGDLPGAFETATGAADRWVTKTKRGVIDLKQTINSEFGDFPDLGVPDLEMPTYPSGPSPAASVGGEAAPALSATGGDVVLEVNGREFYRATLPDFYDENKRFQVTR